MAAETLNYTVIPFFDSQGIPLLTVLTDRGSIINTRFTSTSKTSVTPERRRGLHKPTVFANEDFYSIAFRKKSIEISTRYSLTWMNGSGSITMNGRTAANTITGKHRCRYSWIQYVSVQILAITIYVILK
jgi:hypothetical protein